MENDFANATARDVIADIVAFRDAPSESTLSSKAAIARYASYVGWASGIPVFLFFYFFNHTSWSIPSESIVFYFTALIFLLTVTLISFYIELTRSDTISFYKDPVGEVLGWADDL